MSTMPEIGSKISLISKADIRYEGKLFTVDPNECTIALASVRSFGTEDRQAQYPVPAQSQVYDYILFRGTDIKDITIVNSQQLPNDPAIVSGMAPSMNPPSYQPHFNHAVIGGMGPPINQYGPYNPMASMAPGIGRSMPKQQVPSELVNVVQVPEPQPPPPIVQVPAPAINIPVKDHSAELIAGSRSSTPGLLSRKSPTMDQGVQVSGPSPHRDDKSQNHRPIGHHPVNRDGRHNRGDRGYQDGYQRQQMNDRNDYRQRDHGLNQMRSHAYAHLNQGPQPQRNQGQGGVNNRGWTRVNNGAGGPPRPRGRGRPMSGPPQNFNRAPGTGQSQNQQGQKKNVLKFEDDYDFDKANTEFEEEYKLLRNQMSKIKIAENAESAEPTVPKVNGEEKKDDSGNETGVGEGEPEEEHPDMVFYDKTKSFFDNISCEAVERSKGRSQRTDWRTERKLNSETFGVASARRGNFRGRGGYYHGRGMYRGGYSMNRGGYNRGQGTRPAPRPNNPMNQNSTNAPRPQAQTTQAKQ